MIAHSGPEPADAPLSSTPALYVVATPLGNLADITLRALEVLRGVEVIAAEDTRHTSKLLARYGIRTRLVALHEHNEREAAAALVRRLARGERIALVSDAGTPGVSDPGARAVAAVRAAGYAVVPVPGPNAALAALSVAGLGEAHFLFYGFLPAKPAARRREIEALRALPYALVFYEAPHRIADTIGDLAADFEPERELVIARELTKVFEQIERMTLGEAPAWLAADPNRSRGEFVLVVGSAKATDSSAQAERALRLLLAELPLNRAVKLAAAITGASRNALYARALELARTGGSL